MKKKIMVLSILALSFSAFSFGGNDLVEKLVSQLGVSQEQASGGAGAIFSGLKDGLSKDDFSKLSTSVPGVTDLLDKAPEVQSDLGGMASMLGKDAKKLAAIEKTKKMFKKLGLDEEKLSLYLPVVIDYVKEKGGDKVAGLIGKIF